MKQVDIIGGGLADELTMLYDVDLKEQDDIVDSGQDEPIFDKTNFGNKTDKFSAIKDFKI